MTRLTPATRKTVAACLVVNAVSGLSQQTFDTLVDRFLSMRRKAAGLDDNDAYGGAERDSGSESLELSGCRIATAPAARMHSLVTRL